MNITPTLSRRPDDVVLRWFARLAEWCQTQLRSEAIVHHLDDRVLRDIGLGHLAAMRRR